MSLTERDTRVLLADLFPVVVGEEHVCRETTLGRVGVWDELARMTGMRKDRIGEGYVPFFFLSTLGLVLRVVVFSLGILDDRLLKKR